MRLKGKAVLITGGATGIGRAIVEALSKEGASVVIASRKAEIGIPVAEEIQTLTGHPVTFIATDVTSYEDVERAVDFTIERFGSIDIMINNAGMITRKPLLESDPARDFYRTIEVNQYGVFHGILAASKKMKELGVKGVILNTSSVFAELASYHVMAYQASKAAVIMMTKSAALELATYGIRVLAIQPGGVDTELLGELIGGNQEYIEKAAMGHLRRQMIPASAIGEAVAFLVSDEAYAFNGTAVKLDDGFTIFKG